MTFGQVLHADKSISFATPEQDSRTLEGQWTAKGRADTVDGFHSRMKVINFRWHVYCLWLFYNTDKTYTDLKHIDSSNILA